MCPREALRLPSTRTMTHTPTGVQGRVRTPHGPPSPAPSRSLVTIVVRRRAAVPRMVAMVVVVVDLTHQELQDLVLCPISRSRARTRQSTRPKAKKQTLPAVEEEVYPPKTLFHSRLINLLSDPSLPLPTLPYQLIRKHGQISKCGKEAKMDCRCMVDSIS